ncbi:hypothetical protein H0E87_006896 [Populus deltoides]|uniref:50S ribosomal protein L35 n=1 Tax=Populus deltoides TaxID=3696 RepID=A0A8T2Z8Z3_POPDE|nr:hypothetical protein H0E87_006896 [Populus deltoides]
MQRLCTKLRSLASVSSSHRLLHPAPQSYHRHLHFAAASRKWNLNGSLLNTSSSLPIQLPSVAALSSSRLSQLPLSLVQVRHVSSRERKKRRKPMTPRTSKLKKIKMKAYSSYKERFRTMNDGTIRRWREGKNHNAHSKSKKSKRRLRQPSTVPAAYAKVMKKLNFCG